MKKLLLICLALGLFACTPDANDDANDDAGDDNNENITNVGGMLLKSEIKIQSSGSTEWTKTYEYDTNGNISKATMTTWFDEVFIRTFDYDSNGELISYVEDNTNAFGDKSYYSFYPEYTNGNIVNICIEKKTDDGYNDTIDRVSFEYNANNLATSFIYYEERQLEYNTCETLSTISNTVTLSYDTNGNVIRSENSESLFAPNYLRFEYDAKNHPYANIKPKGLMTNILGVSAVNNQTLIEQYDSETNLVSGSNFYEYTYNENGFPTEKRETFSLSPGTVTYQYTYY